MEKVRAFEVREIKISYQPLHDILVRPSICTSSDALPFLLQIFDMNTIALQEQFVVMYLNRSNKILGMYKASIGGITGTVADPRIILGIALKIAAVSLIMAHNHPSGSLQPSKADEELTCKVKEAAKFMDIKLLDHLIVEPRGSYYSFADEGVL